MDDKELYIDGKLAVLGKQTVIAITKQVNDIGDIETRNGDLSNQFDLPHQQNEHIYENSKQVQSGTSIPYRKLSAKFIDSGVEIISNGYSITEGSDGDKYKITVYNNNSYFFDLIKGKKLRDLDLSDLNHIWDKATIIASNINDEGYIYPIADYNSAIVTGNTAQTIFTNAMYPAFYVKTLLERIVTQLGWTFDPARLELDERYLTEILAFSNEIFQNADRPSEITTEIGSPVQSFHMESTYDSPPASGFTNNLNGYAGAGTLNGNPANFMTAMSSEFIEWQAQGNFTVNKWVAPSTSRVKFKFDADFTVTKTNLTSGNPFIADYFPYGIIWNETQNVYITVVQWSLPNYFINEAHPPYTTQHALNIHTNGIDVNAGDIIRVFTWVQVFGIPDFEFDMTIDNLDFQIEYEKEIIVGGLVDMAQQLPDMTQVDFFKAMMNEFCAIPDSNSSTKTLKLRSFAELTENIGRAKDWSAKVSGNKPSLRYRNGNYYQQNDFIYQHDFGVTPFLGDSHFDIDDENLEPRGTVVESPFGASIASLQTVIQQSGNVLHVPAINNQSSSGGAISPRLLILRRQDVGDGIKYHDAGGDTTETLSLPFCHFILAGYTSLDWDSIITDYWTTIIMMLIKAKIVTDSFDLKAIDVNENFDHFVPVYVHKYSAYFYVNKIIEYQRGKATDVEIIRL